MKKFANFICKHTKMILVISIFLLILSAIGMKMTKINYDILVYLPEDIETIKGQNILTEDFNMGSYSIVIIDNMDSKNILSLEDKIKRINGVDEVVSLYDVVGTTIPIEMLPNEVVDKMHQDNTDLLLITFSGSTSSNETIDAVKQIRSITKDSCKLGGMSSMVLDTMELSEREIMIYIIIAVLFCMIVLQCSLDSYMVPLLLLSNIGCAILFNLGSNIFLGQISYITKALVAVLQLGVTTDFSIFLYHAYEKKKNEFSSKEEAMKEAIMETFTSVMGSSLTTIAGFLVLCTMQLTLGTDLGIVMAKGVLLGVICVLTLFPSLLLICDKIIEKTKHRQFVPKFHSFNQFIIKHRIAIFILFLILLIPAYLGYSNVTVYYKIDKTLPDTLESVLANNQLKEKYNIVSPEMILIDKNIKADEVSSMVEKIKNVDGIDFVLSFSELKKLGLTENMLDQKIVDIFESDTYQVLLVNSIYEVASDELNDQITVVNDIVKQYDEHAIVAGEGPLMKDLITISDTDFNHVNTSSIVCILIILFIVLCSYTLPILLIIAIESAIFTNMSISYFGGVVLPFVAPIVLGTIQLGATIDYAILLTTTYLEKRKNGLSKEKAMLETTDYCGNSIFVSGMCFFAATFGVGIYSKLEMVGSLCTLISRGAIISMFVVITILPSILLIFDKIIMKTTKRKEKSMKKINKVFSLTGLIGILMMSMPMPTYAFTKEETVYTKLNPNGTVQKTLVNEHLVNSSKEDTLEDYSTLKDILNINSDNPFTKKDDILTWQASGKDIFYQGSTAQELPISVSITYQLDGQEMNIEDMLGKSGKVSIQIQYTNLDKHVVRIQETQQTLYTPFVVTMGMMVDADTSSNIEITNGKVVNNGMKNILVGISAPGLYESLKLDSLKELDTITITYETTNFELSSIYSVITPKVIEKEDLKVFDKMDALYDKVNTLQNSMNQLESASLTLLQGSNQLLDGTSQIASNLNLVASKFQEIKNGMISLDSGLTQILEQLQSTQNLLMNQDTSSIVQMQQLIQTNQNTIETFTTLDTQLNTVYTTYQLENVTLEQAIALDPTYQLYQTKLEYENHYESNEKLIALLTANNTALKTSLETFSSLSQKISTLISTLETYLKQIKDGSTDLKDGCVKLSEAVETLASKTVELDQGNKTFYRGMEQLQTGIQALNTQGIQPISTLVNGKVKSTVTKLHELAKFSQEYQSFAGKTSSDEGSTKFILVVDSQKQEKKEIQKEVEYTKVSLWQRFKNLFKK